ncbi:MAG: ATP-binding cassette domain-containing protein [Chloroflexi bacterium]|nr:ATP-binding cassette domain-containing protein [Chloroflexota bacterium]
MAPIVEVRDLAKEFGEFTAVKGITFSVEEGEVFGLLGPNGAGKTTTISILTGILPPSSGTATVAGYDIVKQLPQVKRVNGLVPQELALYPTLSARANLEFFGRVYGLRGRALKERVADVLRTVALTERAEDPVRTFSGGMKRRVNIAAGLVHQPRLLFLDEPTVGVDPQSRNHIFESVLQLNRERGMSIVYTSHYMEEVELLCNRVAIIDQGEIVALDTVKNLIAMLGQGVISVGLPHVDAAQVDEMGALPAVRSANLAPQAAVAVATQPGATGAGDAPAATAQAAPAAPVVRLLVDNSQQALVGLIDYCGRHDLTITALEILEPNLETAFLHLTGRRLRD